MIIDLKIKNFMSIRDESRFTMRANADREHESRLIDIDGNKYSKTKIIYGANASGKTSFFLALDFIRGFFVNSNIMLEKYLIPVRPYKFRKNAYAEPSEFEISFIKDGTKYLYAFSCTQKEVISESLDIYYTAKPTRVFTRTNVDEYKFNIDIKEQTDIKSRNLYNKLFLVTEAAWNYVKAKPVVDFFINDLCVIDDAVTRWKPFFDRIMRENEYDEYRRFCIKMLANADLSIDDFSVETKTIKDVEGQFGGIKAYIQAVTKCSDEELNKLTDENIYNFTTIHNINTGDEYFKYSLPLTEESLGTLQVFYMAPVLYYVFKDGKTLFIDEIDRSLHPLLVEYIVKLFHNEDINVNNAQLIANTHDTNLLNLDIFRRDEIMFTERDYQTGATSMFPLSDFSPRKTENVEKAYLLGRFGAIPFIKGD